MELLGELERGFATWIYPNRALVGLVVIIALAGLVVLGWRRQWHLAARRRPGRTVVGLAIVLAIAGPLGWYLGSPLFLSSVIDEAPPVVAAEASPTQTVAPSPSPSAAGSPAQSAAVGTASPAASVAPELTERSGAFTGADEFHFGKGTARLIEATPGVFTVRLEDFAVRNGPDLFVYLSPSEDGYTDAALELGRLKADRGNQNYKVPAATDVSSARSVVIWCKQFAVQFAWAPLG
jgi:Electron transfer DM13